MQFPQDHQFIRFLQDELQLSNADVALAWQHPDRSTNLPIVLWQYGLIDASQLDRIFDWLESHQPVESL